MKVRSYVYVLYLQLLAKRIRETVSGIIKLYVRRLWCRHYITKAIILGWEQKIILGGEWGRQMEELYWKCSWCNLSMTFIKEFCINTEQKISVCKPQTTSYIKKVACLLFKFIDSNSVCITEPLTPNLWSKWSHWRQICGSIGAVDAKSVVKVEPLTPNLW